MNIQANKFLFGSRTGIFSIARKQDGFFAKTASFKRKETPEGIVAEEKTEDVKKMEELLRLAKESRNSLNSTDQTTILRKVACGEELTEKEKSLLRDIDPKSLSKAQAAARRRREIESRLARAKTKAEAKAILMSAKQEVHMAISAGKSSEIDEYADYLSAAVKKAEERYYRNELKKKAELDIKV